MTMKKLTPTRRHCLATGTALVVWALARPAHATSDDMTRALKAYAGGSLIQEGRVKLDIASLVENGNTVPITVTVQSPMSTTDHVTAIAVFNERNPQTEVFKFALGPRAGRASVSTRIRLATSQKLVAVARMNDGSFWSHSVDVVVTIAACLEEEV